MSGKKSYQSGGYPTQGYPVGGYPQQQYAPPQHPQQPGGYSSVMYAQPAPGVSVTHFAQSSSSPNAYAAPPQGPPPPYSYMPPQQQQYQGPGVGQYPMQQVAQGQTFVANNTFDSGCRFDGIAQPRIPPPPPGVAPNAAQLAAMQGHTVIGTQQRSNFWTGGSGGGYTMGGL